MLCGIITHEDGRDDRLLYQGRGSKRRPGYALLPVLQRCKKRGKKQTNKSLH